MLPYKRSERVAHLLREEIAEIITSKAKDPRLAFVTVTEVDVTPDLRLARVYVSTLKDEEKDDVLEVLGKVRPFIRQELGRRLRMKVIPDLEFRIDTSVGYGQHIEKILRDLKKEEQ
ncbi:MAG: 30S ribosome-binding factor RbfA [Nitrospirota bacterium]|jgi:ribosome-binding factor A